MDDRSTPDALLAALATLRAWLGSLPVGLELAGAEEGRREQAQVAGQIDDYLLPRLRSLDAPLLAVVGGSTGAGKSTLVNSLVGADVSAAGVLRPTTRAPVLVCNPGDRHWFADDRVLPGLARVTGGAPAGGGAVQLVTTEALRPGLALLDAPDIDSVVTSNRELAAQLLAAGDLWIFVTTAARYADAVPWDYLRSARERSTALAVVLNRVPPEATTEVATHLSEMLVTAGLPDAPLFTIAETPLPGGQLPGWAAEPVRSWLDRLAADAEARSLVVRTTLAGALDSLAARVERVAAHLDGQAGVANELVRICDAQYVDARAEVQAGLDSGTLLRGEVLARWQEFVGTGELMRSLQTGIGRLRDVVFGFVTGRPAVEAEVKVALEDSITTLVLAAADRAAERAVRAWDTAPAGRALLQETGRGLDRASEPLAEQAGVAVRDWERFVLGLVAEEGASKRTTAKVVTTGVNAGAVAVMVGLFAHTGGLTGAELAVAGGAATVQQTVLAAVFGDQAVRSLAVRARNELLGRVEHLLGAERARFHALLIERVPAAGTAASLRAASAAVQQARAAE